MKKYFALFGILFLSAACNPFGQALPAGVAKSVNGGVDWQFKNQLKEKDQGSLAGQNISRLDFHPQNREVVFASSLVDGLYKSEDSAETWSKILSKIFVYDFAINPIEPNVIYAAGSFADHGRVLKTIDGGASWNEVYNEESLNNPVRTIALNPNNVNQLIIGTSLGTVVKSSDAGQTWQLAADFKDRVNKISWQSSGIYVLSRSKGLYKSTGFAENFTDITASLNKLANTQLVYDNNIVGNFNQFYVDLSSPSLIYLTTNKGLYKTVDEGKYWMSSNLPIKQDQAENRAIAISRSSSNIVYTSIGATVYKSIDGGISWQTKSLKASGYVNYLLVDPNLPQIVYAGIYRPQ